MLSLLRRFLARPSLSPFIGGLPTLARLRMANAFGTLARAARAAKHFSVRKCRQLLGYTLIRWLSATPSASMPLDLAECRRARAWWRASCARTTRKAALWPACRRRSAVAGRQRARSWRAPHHHGAAIPIEDDDLEPSGRVGERAFGQHRGRVAEDKRRALPGQNYARTDERYPVITISDAILGDSSHHNFACKTFGVQVLSPRSMLGSMSSNPASICNQTRLHSTHLRAGSGRPS
jgi:hypothetical protein